MSKAAVRSAKLLEELRNLLDGAPELVRYSEERPSHLWHYTSADGLQGILQSSRLRCSHARLTNDLTEIAFGWDFTKRYLEKEYRNERELRSILPATFAYGDNLHGNVHYFVFCLSERADSISQWRAYGRGGAGYAICFAADKLLVATGIDPTSLLLRGRTGAPSRCMLSRILYKKYE